MKTKPDRRAYNARWRRTHPESVQASNRKQFEKNREARRAYDKKYALEHREQRRDYARRYHAAHYAKNRERLIAQTKAYAAAHPEIRRKIHLNYKRNHPEKFRAQVSASHVRRKARMRLADVSDARVNELIRKWHLERTFICFYCKRQFGTLQLTIDHVLPVSKGGKHSVDNICKSCPSCNPSKGTKLISRHSVNGQLLLI